MSKLISSFSVRARNYENLDVESGHMYLTENQCFPSRATYVAPSHLPNPADQGRNCSNKGCNRIRIQPSDKSVANYFCMKTMERAMMVGQLIEVHDFYETYYFNGITC